MINEKEIIAMKLYLINRFWSWTARALKFGIVLFLIGGAIAFSASDTTLPSGADILNKYITATGGISAYDKIRNRITRSTLDIKDRNMKMSIITYAAKPDKIYIVMETPETGRVVRGMSEGVVWEKNVASGAQIKYGEERLDGLRDAAFDKFVYWQEAFQSADCVGIDTVDNKPCYKVVMKPKMGHNLILHFDRNTGLILRIDFAIRPQKKLIEASIIMSDYRPVDGILLAFKTQMNLMGESRIMTIDSIRQNAPIPDSVFALPTDIRNMLKYEEGVVPVGK